MKRKPKSNGGRPSKPIKIGMVERLAEIHCTNEEIASVLECSVDTITRRFADEIARARDRGKASLRRMQWAKAKQQADDPRGRDSMLIWLGKQLLGQKDQINLQKLSDEDLVALATRVFGGDVPAGLDESGGDPPDSSNGFGPN